MTGLRLPSSLKNIFRLISPVLATGIIIFLVLHFRPSKKTFYFHIEKGESLYSVAERLKKLGVVKDVKGFVVLSKILGKEKRIKPGWYYLNTGMEPVEILDKLGSGERVRIKVTIPEGLTIEQTASILQKRAKIDSSIFVSLCYDSSLINKFGIDGNSIEGYLFPTTYYIPLGEEPAVVIRDMVKTFFKKIIPYIPDIQSRGRKLKEIVIIASMIEKEALLDREKPIIASVIYNRLKKGMRLQIDATVQYALGEHHERVLFSHLKVNSPYNTYRIKGLPPGPICSPGMKSLEAAIYPAKTDYFYYVAKGDGSHIFSKTFAQHMRAKRMVRRKGG